MSDAGIIAFTLGIAAVSTIVIAPFALLLAALSWRAPSRLRTVLDAIGALPLVLPPTAVGFLLLQLLSRRHLLGGFLAARGIEILFTWRAVVIASAVMSFPLMFTAFRVAIDSTDVRLFRIARTLGVTPARAFARVTLPLSARGLIGGIVLAYCRAIGEFGATILIAGNIPGSTQTIALAIYERVQMGHDHEALPLLGCVVLIAMASIITSEWLIRSRRRRIEA
jgi:molybdate transport system permease protein